MVAGWMLGWSWMSNGWVLGGFREGVWWVLGVSWLGAVWDLDGFWVGSGWVLGRN